MSDFFAAYEKRRGNADIGRMNRLLSIFLPDASSVDAVITRAGFFLAGDAVAHVYQGKDPSTYKGDLEIWFCQGPPREDGYYDKAVLTCTDDSDEDNDHDVWYPGAEERARIRDLEYPVRYYRRAKELLTNELIRQGCREIAEKKPHGGNMQVFVRGSSRIKVIYVMTESHNDILSGLKSTAVGYHPEQGFFGPDLK
jgi:hypothetical protein